jgi:hypothetical protein
VGEGVSVGSGVGLLIAISVDVAVGCAVGVLVTAVVGVFVDAIDAVWIGACVSSGATIAAGVEADSLHPAKLSTIAEMYISQIFFISIPLVLSRGGRFPESHDEAISHQQGDC